MAGAFFLDDASFILNSASSLLSSPLPSSPKTPLLFHTLPPLFPHPSNAKFCCCLLPPYSPSSYCCYFSNPSLSQVSSPPQSTTEGDQPGPTLKEEGLSRGSSSSASTSQRYLQMERLLQFLQTPLLPSAHTSTKFRHWQHQHGSNSQAKGCPIALHKAEGSFCLLLCSFILMWSISFCWLNYYHNSPVWWPTCYHPPIKHKYCTWTYLRKLPGCLFFFKAVLQSSFIQHAAAQQINSGIISQIIGLNYNVMFWAQGRMSYHGNFSLVSWHCHQYSLP